MMGESWGNFGDVLRQRAQERPDAQAFAFLDRHGTVTEERTFADLDARARGIAGALAARGLKGKPVLLVYPSGLDFVDALFGCFYAGAIAVPAPYAMARRAGDRIGSILRDCQPDLVLTLARLENDAEIRGAADNFSSELPFLFTDRLEGAASEARPSAAREDIALLQYTSGSVAAPKGVMLSHGNLLANSAMIHEAFGHDVDLRGVGWLPLFHDMGLIGHVLQPVYAGGLSVLISPLTFLQRPFTWVKAISDWRATTSGGPNHAYELCTRLIRDEQIQALDLSSWRVAYCGAEMVRAEVLNRFADKFSGTGFRRDALYPCYGLAEATLMVTGVSPGAGMTAGNGKSSVACGRTWLDCSVRIVDPVKRVALPDGETGEIWVKGANVGQGYWRRPEESQSAFGGTLDGDPDTFLRTGDLGLVEGGELFVAGRIKDTIIVRGSNHAPEDIEATIGSADTAFATQATAAFGLDVGGQEEVVVIQEAKGAAGSDGWEAPLIRAFEAVTREHGLRLYDFVLVRPGSIPRTSSGKIRRGRCREMYEVNEFDRLGVWASLRTTRRQPVGAR
jgi:acyl-CoA synthetase (AMP-forming)/AMP-acid ligase II